MKNNDEMPIAFYNTIEIIKADPTANDSKILAQLIESLVDSVEFDLDKINKLSNKDLADLCSFMFNQCMSEGLSEEQRLNISGIIEPYAAIGNNETRH